LKPATFTESKTHQWEAKNLKYPHHIHRKTVGNSIKLKRPLLITGPNASGKTTLLKSAFLNTLLSQQIGRGFYDKLILKPYDEFHCYLDIPDTSGRDSLFQAEARRCLDIVKSVDVSKKRYFCIFDELYSGTNPIEAVAGAFAFTRFLAKRSNVSFLITTHFYDFCKLCDTHKVGVRNCQMGWNCNSRDVSDTSDDVKFTYKVKSGVSKLRGGVRVLKQIGYPSAIVNDALTILKDYV
jgi:DNA mismatch repair ATPase MutS